MLHKASEGMTRWFSAGCGARPEGPKWLYSRVRASHNGLYSVSVNWMFQALYRKTIHGVLALVLPNWVGADITPTLQMRRLRQKEK